MTTLITIIIISASRLSLTFLLRTFTDLFVNFIVKSLAIFSENASLTNVFQNSPRLESALSWTITQMFPSIIRVAVCDCTEKTKLNGNRKQCTIFNIYSKCYEFYIMLTGIFNSAPHPEHQLCTLTFSFNDQRRKLLRFA